MAGISYYDIVNSALVILFFLIITGGSLTAQNTHKLKKTADKEYTKGMYSEAEENYRKALDKEPDVKAHFNLGNSLFNQQRFEEAREQFDKAIANTDDPKIQSRAYYNKGNTWFNEQKLDKSIEAYKHALRLDPGDDAAKKNLFLTQQLLKQQQQQDQEQQDQEQQDQEQKDQEQQDQEQQDQEQQDQEQQDQEQQEEKQQQEQQEAEELKPEEQDSTGIDSLIQKNITREELMKLLKAIEEEDKKIQQKLRRGSSKKKKSDKDW